jgi:predicted DNA-binding antitoxin AbrB/MazE fold protein/predicted nucleic acid-binding protein
MSQHIDAIFENGVFRPEAPVNIPDGQRVCLNVESKAAPADDLSDVADLARYFLDPSALVKRYHQEHGSADVEALFRAPGNRFLISRLALVELHSSFARLVREGVLDQSDFNNLIARLEADVASDVLTVAAVSSRRLEGACALLATHGSNITMRTLDAIHLASAQAFHARTRLAAFVAADKKLLAAAASACGLSVLDVG